MTPPEARRRPGANRTADVVRHGGRGDSDNVTDPALFDVVARRDAYGRQTVFKPAVETHALDNAGDWWQQTARQAIRAMAETRSTFTIDDLRENGLVPEPVNPTSAWGAAVSAVANSGEIQNVGYRRSRRKSSHSRIVSVWTKAS